MKVAQFAVTPELLRMVLCLPEGTVIVGAGMNDRGDVTFTAQHDGLVDQPGRSIGYALPVFQRTDRMVRESEFVSWGQEKTS